jgi:hypothetical protein
MNPKIDSHAIIPYYSAVSVGDQVNSTECSSRIPWIWEETPSSSPLKSLNYANKEIK